MNTNEIVSAIDAEIAKLQQARALLSGSSEPAATKRGPGRPKKAAAPANVIAKPVAPKRGPGRPKKVVAPVKAVAKRTLSAEGKARIAAAQKRRWAAAKESAK
ncbi:hypothetical protein Terro_2984 [Terriglobus roseus DSM 18391]|uniref:Uncharacterized protein n=1 Tax=Terriglobus roseus (strain DSM 18391 / NRRL B-41598 / KBS 63) TaxID=926566 RepID=I3ZIZ8_TERRK|nr:hypothetical protein [Terriglobus roseus]AFL89216.1 hypothetical protein Terro_2984 [Terriglobus roseus DSM 18391]